MLASRNTRITKILARICSSFSRLALFSFVNRLEIDPEFLCDPEVLCQAQGRVRCNRALAVHDRLNTIRNSPG